MPRNFFCIFIVVFKSFRYLRLGLNHHLRRKAINNWSVRAILDNGETRDFASETRYFFTRKPFSCFLRENVSKRGVPRPVLFLTFPKSGLISQLVTDSLDVHYMHGGEQADWRCHKVGGVVVGLF